MIGRAIRKGPRIKQVNMLAIHDCPDAPEDRRFQVWSPRGMQEEFSTLDAAVEWCEETLDFVERTQ